MKTRPILIVAIVLSLALCNPALAKAVTLEVTGVVNYISTQGGLALDGSVTVGSVMTGYCTYDTDTPDQYESDWWGLYEIDAISITIGNYTFTHDLNSDSPILFSIGTIDYNYVVETLSPRFDGTVTINGLSKTWDDINWSSSRLTLLDVCSSSNELNLSDTLPESVPDISIFNWRREFYARFVADDSSSFYIYGEVASLTVVPGLFEVAPAEVDFHYYLGDPNPEPQILSIWAKEVDTLNWQITEDCNWLDASPTSGQSSGEIDEVILSVDISGLDIGSYSCLLTVYDPNVPDYIRYLPVNLFIGSKLFVPSQYLTIQDAIDAADNYDIVLVADGVYSGEGNRDIDFLGKSIIVRSENGPENCIIDCNGTRAEPHLGLYFHSGEDRNSAVSGFSIINGYARYGGGGAIYCGEGSSPKVTNCTISGNEAREGGGIYCYCSNPTLTNCIITDNIGSGIYCRGGGLECENSCSPTITNCTITSNYGLGRPPRTHAGGIYCYGSSPTITNCIISGNTADGSGGGVSCSYSSPTITNCIITGHMVAWDGGGIYCDHDSSPKIVGCIITQNSSGEGGGIYCDYQCSPEVINCTISENIGEGIYCYSCVGTLVVANSTISRNSGYNGGIYCCGDLTITNSTITNNSARYKGGGIYCKGNSTIIDCNISHNAAKYSGGVFCWGDSITIERCVISNNSALKSGGGLFCTEANALRLTNCLISGNSASQKYGGIFLDAHGHYDEAELTIANCTLTGNIAGHFGGGISCVSGNLLVSNSVFWDNLAPDGAEMSLGSNANVYVSYTDVQGGPNDVYIDPDCTLNWGLGNIDFDPCFVEPGYWANANDPNIIVEPNDPNAIWLDGDYHLLPDSPCMDAGDPNYIPEPNETDLDGNPRVNGGRIDMGAYESIMHEARLLILPRVINRKSHQPRIMAWLRLPQGITRDQIDKDVPLILYPGGIKAVRQFVFQNRRRGARRTSVFAFFDKAELMDAIDTNGPVQLQVLGHLLKPGQYFYGSDTIRIITRRLPHRPHRRRR